MGYYLQLNIILLVGSVFLVASNARVRPIEEQFVAREPSTPGSEGTIFLVGFMQNIFPRTAGNAVPDAYLLVTTNETGVVVFDVTIMFCGSSTYTVDSSSPTRVNFPADDVYVTNIQERHKAIWVQTSNNKKISIKVVNDEFRSTDGFVALPCDGMTALSDFRTYEYLVLSTNQDTTDQSGSTPTSSQFLVITCEDDTEVEVAPSTAISGSGVFQHTRFGPGESQASSNWQVNPNTNLIPAKQTLLISITNVDLTGTLVKGNKPLVVISGHQCGQVTERVTACDHMSTQIPPHTTWGYTFLLNPLSGRRSGDLYRFATLQENTDVNITCVDAESSNATVEYTATLNSAPGSNWGQFETHSEGCSDTYVPKYCCLESSNPVVLAQYSYGYTRDASCNGGELGDPFMSVIPPIVQYLRLYHLVPVNISSGPIVNHFFSVSVHARYFQMDRIMLDNAPLEANATLWQAIYCSSGQICGYGITKDFDNQYHSLFHADANAAIFVHTYGFSIQNSYAIAGGMELQPISGTIISCTVPADCVVEGSSVTVTCTRSIDLSEQSRIRVNTEDGSAVAPADYTALNIPENRPSVFAGNVLNYRGGSRQDSVISFDVQVASDSIVEPSEVFYIDVTSVRTAIVATPRVTVTICRDGCDMLENPENGVVVTTGLAPSDTATYTCNSGYELVGTSVRTCSTDGEWSDIPPTCRPVCPTLGDPANGMVSLTGTSIGDTATYTCNEGHKLVGAPVLNCQSDGMWDNSPPICKQQATPGSEGTKFLVGFMQNVILQEAFIPVPDAYLLVTTSETGVVEFDVKTMFGGVQRTDTYTVDSSVPTRVNFPADDVYVTNIQQRDKAIWMQTSNNNKIAVKVVNDGFRSSDGFVSLPCDSMTVPSDFRTYEYLVLSTNQDTTDQSGSTATSSQFLVITCDADTEVEVAPSTAISGSGVFQHTQFGPGTSQASSNWRINTINNLIPAQQTLLISITNQDLTGTLIKGNKPLVVISGHQCGQVTERVTACDHMAAQIPPHTTWGYTFLLNPLSGRRSGDLYRFATLQNNTDVAITCVDAGSSTATVEYTATLNSAQGSNWGQFETHSEGCSDTYVPKYCCLESSNPVVLAQYSYGYTRDVSCNGGLGDPFMSVIPPIVQYLRLYHLVPVSISSGPIVNHFFSVSVHARYFQIDRIMLDNAPLEANATLWQAIYCSSGQICGYGITKDFDNQYHALFHADANAAIFVHTYGFSIQNSYAIAGGMELQPISGTIISCTVPADCVVEGSSVTVTCTRSLDLSEHSRIQVNTEDGSAIAPGDYTALNITENQPNILPNNILNYRGRSVQDSVIQFVITTKVDSEDIIEPSEAFLLNVSPVRTAIVLTPQLEVVICPDCAPGYTICQAGDIFVCISADVDDDCMADEQDNCRDVGNYDQRDRDGDGVGDACDNCVLTSNKEQENADGDGAGRACDADDNDPGVVATLRLRDVTVKEDVGQAQVCVTVEKSEKPGNGSMMCLIDFPFSIIFETISDSAVSPDDFTARNIIRTFGECTISLCVNIPIKNDSTLEQKVEVFQVLITLESEASLRNISLTQNETTVFINDTDDEVLLKLDRHYIEVLEDADVSLCVSIATSVACAVGFGAFYVEISLSSIEGDVGEDFSYSSLNLSFTACEQMACHMLPIRNDDVIERNKSFQFMLQRTPDLDERIKLDPTIGNLTILNDDNVMAVGFSSTTYTTTETIGNVNVCVAVTNPPSGGAVRPFSVTILPGEEESNREYELECSRELNFQEGKSELCHNYNITQDIECELEGKQAYFTLELGLRSTVGLSINPIRSTATVSIDDSREMECYVSVWYERTSYTISQQNDNVTICVISTSPGIEEMFTINIITNNRTANSNLIEQSTYSLDFVANESNSNATECYTISVDFDATDICEYFLCNTEEIVSMLKVDETVRRVQFNRSMTLVIIEPPMICECIDPPPTPFSSSDGIIIAATIPSLVLVIAVVSIAVVIIVYRKWTKKQNILKQIQLEEDKVNVTLSDHYSVVKTSVLSEQLRQQLSEKWMLFSKNELELSSTVGQGESGQVYKGYLNTALGKELVAVKTVKALCSACDAERLVKEVSTMLSFEHTNVMSLVGVCLNGDIPLLIMPFMSNGSVLEFVKHHREELLCIDAIEIQVVSARKTLLNISHQISKGMEYLALERFVHRDLAARNCMIDRDGVIKVADFGLTEDMYGTNYFRREGGSEEKVPIRWMAPESIEEDIYTEATDVWSFGVTVWEIFTCGRIPYTGIPAMGLLKELQRGQRLERPDNEACLDEVYEIMMSCWSLDSNARPLFKDLVGRISGLLERESDYLELSQSLCWKETVSHTPPPASPPTEQETCIN